MLEAWLAQPRTITGCQRFVQRRAFAHDWDHGTRARCWCRREEVASQGSTLRLELTRPYSTE